MPSTFLGIETSRRGLQAHQRSLETTGHNIANANTPGYSRQQAVHTTSTPLANPVLLSKMTPGQLGTGVEVNVIRRIRNEYLDTQARESTSSLSYWASQEEVYARIEAIFPEPGSEGIGGVMTRFFRTWHDLNNAPQDPGVRSAVAEVGGELATMLTEAYNQLGFISNNIYKVDSSNNNVIGGQMYDDLETVKDIINQLHSVNSSIETIYKIGNQPNDLLDKRDSLIDKLSEFGPVEVLKDSPVDSNSNEIEIKFFGKNIDEINTNDMALKYTAGVPNTTPDEIKLYIGTDEISLTGSLGELAGLEKVRGRISNQVNGYMEKLNIFAEALNDEINKIISPDGAYDMFTGSLKDGDFAVNMDIVNNDDLGIYATDVARLYEEVIPYLGDGMTLNEYYNGVLAEIGSGSGSASSMAENQTAINQQIASLRESASGVSLDEELSLMIQFQYGYQASARVMTTLDGMIDYLINRTGSA